MIATWIHVVIVVASCILFCVDSLPTFQQMDSSVPGLNDFIAGALTLELLVRFVTAPDLQGFATSSWTWVDALSVLPYFIALIVVGSDGGVNNTSSGEFIFSRLARLFRAMRIVRLGGQSLAIRAFYGSIGKSRSGLGLLLFLFSVLVVIGASVVYVSEQTIEYWDNANNRWIYNDGTISPFQSVIHTSWFVIVSITTVGYGDEVVRSALGKAVTSCILLLGPFVIAFPTVILSSNFAETHAALLKEAQQKESSEGSGTAEERNLKHARRRTPSDVKYFAPSRVALEYTISPGAPSRAISLKNYIALYDPLLLIRCRSPQGEQQYGFQSTSSAHVTIKDNYPHGVVVRFYLLLHTQLAHDAATTAVHNYMRDFPKTRIDSVAPRPIRSIRVSFRSKHQMLQTARVVCSKYKNPFGTIGIDLVCRVEALPVLLRFSSNCAFTFHLEYHDGSESTTVLLHDFTNAEVTNLDQHEFSAYGRSISFAP